MRNVLHLRYRSVRWVRHLLNDEQRDLRVKMCKDNLRLFKSEGHNIMNRLITGDETWIYFYDQLSQEAKLWVFEDEDVPQLPKKEVHVKKIMLAVFSDQRV